MLVVEWVGMESDCKRGETVELDAMEEDLTQVQ